MHIRLQSPDTQTMHTASRTLPQDLQQAGIAEPFELQPVQLQPLGDGLQKGGEVASLATIALTAVGAGGAVAVAMGKDGFFTALAHVLEKYVEQKIEITVKNAAGEEVRLAGSAGQIRKLLAQLTLDESS